MKKVFNRHFIAFYSILIFSCSSSADSIQVHNKNQDKQSKVETIYITSGFTAPISEFYRLVMHEIDRQLPQIKVEYEVLTAERSINLVNRGINDAECCRIPQVVTKNYKDLIPVTESFYDARFTAFSKRDDLQINSFDDLKPYATATVLGWKILVNNLNRVDPKEKYILSTPAQMMQMLKKDRIEVALLGYESGVIALRNADLQDVHIYLNPPLAEKPLYLMLHKHNKHLIEPISKVIKNLKESGEIERLYHQAFISPIEPLNKHE